MIWGVGGGYFFQISPKFAPNGSIDWQCFSIGSDNAVYKVMVGQNWAGPVEFDPGQVKIIINYIRREIFWTFLGDSEEILIWNTG